MSYEFEAEKVETEKYGEHISIKYLVEVSYNDDYYNVDKSTSFIQILKDKGWTNEFAKLTKTPFVFFTKVNNKGEKTAMKGSMLYRLSGEKMAFKDHEFLGGKSQGYPKNKFKDGYLMIGSKEADAAIDSYLANFDIAKRHMENVMRTVETGKEFEGYLKINSQLKKP